MKGKSIIIDGVEYVPKTCDKPHVDDNGLKYAIVRSRNQGVMCGFVKKISGQEVTLKRARQIWRYSSRFVLPDLAEYGLTTKFESKLSCEMSQDMVMLEACGVMFCTEKAAKSLIEIKAVNNDE